MLCAAQAQVTNSARDLEAEAAGRVEERLAELYESPEDEIKLDKVEADTGADKVVQKKGGKAGFVGLIVDGIEIVLALADDDGAHEAFVLSASAAIAFTLAF